MNKSLDITYAFTVQFLWKHDSVTVSKSWGVKCSKLGGGVKCSKLGDEIFSSKKGVVCD